MQMGRSPRSAAACSLHMHFIALLPPIALDTASRVVFPCLFYCQGARPREMSNREDGCTAKAGDGALHPAGLDLATMHFRIA